MPRGLTVGNGNLLLNFDQDYNIRDIHYPYGVSSRCNPDALEGQVALTATPTPTSKEGPVLFIGQRDLKHGQAQSYPLHAV